MKTGVSVLSLTMLLGGCWVDMTAEEALDDEATMAKSLELVAPADTGPLSRGLVARLAQHADHEMIEVDVFLRDPLADVAEAEKPTSARGELRDGQTEELVLDGRPATRADIEAHQARQHERFRQRALTARERMARVRAELAQRTGVAFAAADGTSARARMRAADIRTLAEKHPDLVRSIDEAYRAEGNDAALSGLIAVGISSAAFDLGFDGDNVGVWMNDGDGRPDLNNSAIDTTDLTVQDFGSEALQAHATQTLATLMLAAPEAHVHYGVPSRSCNLRTDVATYTNPPVYLSSQSNTYGDDSTTYTSCAADWDDFIYDTRIAHFAAVGNSAANVRGAAKAYNVIGVGAFDDNASPYAMAGFSDFIDPETGADKPEIVGPGVDIDIAGFTGLSGTSYATPIAGGFAADLLEAFPYLRYQPQLLKAHLLTNSVNVDGAAPFSDKDGAGKLDFERTYYNGRWAWWNGGNNSWFSADTDGDGRLELTFTESLVAGATYRVAISWLVKGSHVKTAKTPNMDIDLRITAPNGASWSSLTASQSYEMIEFVAPQTGTYTVVIERYSNSGVGDVVLGYHLNW